MTDQEIWNCETPVAELLGVNVPEWIEQDIAASTIASIAQGGCASGAYMPAVTYWTASDVMAAYGDDVLDYIDDTLGELPTPPSDESWKGLACFYLSHAIELWAWDILAQLGDLELKAA
jgi:hypothetical protein